jgi:hypothetical protein
MLRPPLSSTDAPILRTGGQEAVLLRPPSQGWRTFLRNHAPNIAAMDLFNAFVIVRLDRRDLVWINVTTNG